MNPVELSFLLQAHRFGGGLRSFYIEKMDFKDLDEVVSLSAALSNPWSKNMFIEEMHNPLSHCFTIGKKEASRAFVVGFICFRIVSDESELLNLCVHPRYRQSGIGRKLMQFYTDFCTERRIKSFYLEVNAANQPALRLYELFCYQPFGTRKKFYEGKWDALLMVKNV